MIYNIELSVIDSVYIFYQQFYLSVLNFLRFTHENKTKLEFTYN